MAQFKKNEIVSGVFILLAVGVFALFAFQVGGFKLPGAFQRRATLCSTFFSDVKTLEVGQKVTVGGQRVGKVVGIRIAGPEEGDLARFLGSFPGTLEAEERGKQVLRVDFEVWDDQKLRIDSASGRIQLATDGFLGTHFLKLDPGILGAAGQALEELGRAGPVLIGTHRSTELGDLTSDAAAMLVEAKSILKKVDQRMLSAKNLDRFDSILVRIDEALVEVPKIATQIRNLTDPAHPDGLHARVLNPVQSLLTTSEAAVSRLSKEVLEVTLPKSHALIDSATAAVQEAHRGVEDMRRAIADVQAKLAVMDPKVNAILDNLAVTTGNLETRLDAMQGQLIATLAQAEGLIADARPEVAETLQTLRRAMWELEIAMRKLRANPATLIWGDKEPVLNVAPTDESDRTKTGRARPFGQREESDGD